MIDFENVSKTYPNGTNALHNVTLHIDKGEFVFIVGASGAGKSTFLKLIMREEIPTSGEITINGNKLSRLKKRHVPYLRRHMGIVFQDFRLIDKMNVFDNVAFAMRAVGESTATVKKRVPYVLDLVGLKDKMKNKPSELSGGEQQRVSLARALVNNPEIIIADEPTGNIDPELSHEILDLLSQINAMGTTVLVVTHEHELVREFNHRVIAIDKGKVISDTPAYLSFTSIPSAYADYDGEYGDEDEDELLREAPSASEAAADDGEEVVDIAAAFAAEPLQEEPDNALEEPAAEDAPQEESAPQAESAPNEADPYAPAAVEAAAANLMQQADAADGEPRFAAPRHGRAADSDDGEVSTYVGTRFSSRLADDAPEAAPDPGTAENNPE